MNALSINPKVAATAASGAIVTIVAWVLATFAKVTLPPDVTAAATTLIGFGVGYLTKAA